ncbi:unnamed protein product [Cyprideis torosa]|uniref:Uncharacterized protein n=1 Tax=Cyprideis torosa TaxID=163714 RepID=A0A7R8WNM8_9CRUS|nr:unnamed protein product [Cyprideis torosa]CAG0900598.1 unnamed protein product [Cyprideis torosa]
MEGTHSTPLHFATGYNRVSVVEFLLQHGADVDSKDREGLLPLQIAFSYGYYEVCEFVVRHGAAPRDVVFFPLNRADRNRKNSDLKTPLDVVKEGDEEVADLMRGYSHGMSADRNRKNSDLKTPLDVVKEGDEEVADLLRGEAALLEASKKGSVSRVKNLVTLSPAMINCRDSQARNSTPLHLAAGYNNLEVAEYLLENGADVNAQDKGGLIHLYNASSYGNLDIAANSDLKTPLDVVKEGDEEVADLMRGEAALLEASKKGSVSRVKNLVTLSPALINCRDSQARNSTPLHEAS